MTASFADPDAETRIDMDDILQSDDGDSHFHDV